MKKATVRQYAYFAQAAYTESPSGYLNGYTRLEYGSNTGWWKRTDSHDSFIFRGTNEWADWRLSNLKFTPHRSCKDYKAHSGFYSGALDLFSLAKQRAMLHPDYPIEIIGHSLGGAIGVQFAGMCADLGLEVSRVITFGAPRTMDQEGAEKFKAQGLDERKIVQVRNGADPVCRIMLSMGTLQKAANILGIPATVGAWHPYCQAIITNHHTGEILEGPEEWEHRRKQEPDTLTRFEEFRVGLRNYVEGISSVDDHMIYNYIKALG